MHVSIVRFLVQNGSHEGKIKENQRKPKKNCNVNKQDSNLRTPHLYIEEYYGQITFPFTPPISFMGHPHSQLPSHKKCDFVVPTHQHIVTFKSLEFTKEQKFQKIITIGFTRRKEKHCNMFLFRVYFYYETQIQPSDIRIQDPLH